MNKEWFDTLSASILVCDKEGIIVYMNKGSEEEYKKYGGSELIGSNLFDCHQEPSRKILKEMFKNASERIYTIEKAGVKKFICQKPIFEKGKFAGIMEMVIVLPSDMPHHIRD